VKFKHSIVTTLTAVGILIAMPLSAMAATTTGSSSTSTSGGANGYRISPVRTDLNINPGQTEDVTVIIQNVSSNVEQLQTLINDFTARDESGSPALLLNGQSAGQHGLKQFITVPNGAFSLQPNEQKDITVHITIPKGTPGGGYFGAVRFAPAGSTGNENVNLSASVTSLILVRVSGNVTDLLNIASFDTQKKPDDVHTTPSASTFFTSGKNLQVAVRFQNQGNVQEQPFGKVILKKGSKVIDQQEINNVTNGERSNVLPGTVRRFTVDLHNTKSYGKYTVEGNFGYGSNGQLLSAKKSFYVVPVALIIIVLAVIVGLILLLIIVPRVRRNYRVVKNRR